MNKKFLSVILFSALTFGATGMFTSCKDYDDDIKNINDEVAAIKSSVTDLQNKVGNGKFVTNIVKDGDGITVTWNDGTSSKIETIKGDKGDKGEKGDAPTIEIDPTTKNWKINGTDTGICAAGVDGAQGPAGIDAKSPSISEETGNWVVYTWNAEKKEYDAKDTGVSAKGANAYVTDKGSYYELNVAVDKAGTAYTQVKLPKTTTILSLQAAVIDGNVISAANVNLNYGKKLTDVVKFNGKEYAKGTILLSQTSTLSTIVNPADADATAYKFALKDSKGNVPFVVSAVKPNMTEKALTRAEATVNSGVYDMTVEYADTKYCGKAKGTYALTTETANGVVASPYDVKIEEREISSVSAISLNSPLSVDMNKELDLTKCFVKTGVSTINRSESVNDLRPYIVDYYFEVADKTAADAIGATIDGDIFKATSKSNPNLKVKVYALLVSGVTMDKTIDVKVNYVAPVSALDNVEWTINKKTADVYLPIEAIQSSLTGNTDRQFPGVHKVGKYTFADGTALTEKTVTVNGKNYGKAPAGKTATAFDEAWFGVIASPNLYAVNNDGDYVEVNTLSGATIRTPMFVKFTFDYTVAFPGEYIVKLGFKKNNTGDNVVEVPVNVIIKSPAESDVNPFRRLDAYFNGNDATAYGVADGSMVDYNLFRLYADLGTEKTNVVFSETEHDSKHHSTAYGTCKKWIVDPATGDIKVNVYDNADKADNTDNVYSTRAIKAAYTVFGNEHIAKIVDEFNLTVKSEIKEGTITVASAANAKGNGVTPIMVSFKNFTAKDVYGENYNIYTKFKKSGSNYVEDASNAADPRIEKVTVELGDQNAKDYLVFTDAQGNVVDAANAIHSTGSDVNACFRVMKKADVTALVDNVPCKITVKVLDKWHVYKTFDVTVTLEK